MHLPCKVPLEVCQRQRPSGCSVSWRGCYAWRRGYTDISLPQDQQDVHRSQGDLQRSERDGQLDETPERHRDIVIVAKLLDKAQLIFVDLDRYPAPGTALGVVSVRDVLLIDGKGMIVDRLQDFEPPEPVLVRLKKLLSKQ